MNQKMLELGKDLLLLKAVLEYEDMPEDMRLTLAQVSLNMLQLVMQLKQTEQDNSAADMANYLINKYGA